MVDPLVHNGLGEFAAAVEVLKVTAKSQGLGKESSLRRSRSGARLLPLPVADSGV